jgi:hypothetical protein
MKPIVAAMFMLSAVLFAAADVHAFAWGGGRPGTGGGQHSGWWDTTRGPKTSVPEPSTLYAIGSALGILGGAGWYIRRRK